MLEREIKRRREREKKRQRGGQKRKGRDRGCKETINARCRFFPQDRMRAGKKVLSVTMTKGHRLRRPNAQNEHSIK